MYKTAEILNLSHTLAGEELEKFIYPFEAVPFIGEIILKISRSLTKEYEEIYGGVFVHKTAEISPTAKILAPCIIGAGTKIRHCAFIRGNALIGDNCVIGNSTEIKNTVLFNGVQAPHFNYVGDSILGFKAHTGAGVILSNVKADKSQVSIDCGGEKFYTGLKKLGAVLGDGAEIGCNSVLNPGTVIGRGAIVYPLSCVRGTVPAESIYKNAIVIKKK